MLMRLSLSAVEQRIHVELAPDNECLDTQSGGDLGLWTLQRARVLTAYEETQGNISETARRLGISRNTVYRALAQTPKR
jgi:transcriptional regulator of acetoin/glycerol metabolism